MTPTILTSVPLTVLVLVGVGAPALLLGLLGAAALLNRSLPERWTAMAAGVTMSLSCGALLTAFFAYGWAAGGARVHLVRRVVDLARGRHRDRISRRSVLAGVRGVDHGHCGRRVGVFESLPAS